MKTLLKLCAGMLLFFGVVLTINRYGNPNLLLVFLSLACGAPFVYLLVVRNLQQNQLLAMKEEALRAELLLLKNQINPHFFFNTLNNLYGLAIEKSDLAPEMILRLSDLMRFVIYEGKKDLVVLSDEIAYLEHFMELHRIRFHQLDFRGFQKNIADMSLKLPPLLLIIPLENAFKHGAASKLNDAFIELQLDADQSEIHFMVRNNFDESKHHQPGIGMTNLKRRLELLYPQNHQLVIQSKQGIYQIDLRFSTQ